MLRKKSVSSNFHFFEGIFAILVEEKTIYVNGEGLIFSWYFLEFERIRGRIPTFQKLGPFSVLSVQNRPNWAGDLSGHSTFYSSPFELCGRTIGKLATLYTRVFYENGVSLECVEFNKPYFTSVKAI